MFALFSIGRAVESEIGSTKFGLSYLLAGVFSGLLHIFFNQSSDIMVIGASGAVFGALAMLLLLMPFKFTSAMIIPMPGVVLGISMLVVEVSAILYNTDVWVAHDVHLYGFIAGGLAAFGIDYDRALRGLIISVIILIGLYYWVFYIEGIVI
jgi:membrane associated rhomboid family serine protease